MGRGDPLVGAGPKMKLREGTVLEVQPDPFLPDDTFFRCHHEGRTMYVRSDDTELCGDEGHSPTPDASPTTGAPQPPGTPGGGAPNAQPRATAMSDPEPPEQERRERPPPLDESGPPPVFKRRRTSQKHSRSIDANSRKEQPAERGAVLPEQAATPAGRNPDPRYAKTNAFAAIGFPALSSTADLRKASQRAQIKLKMARDARPDPAASSLERLVGDPTFRMREAAAWYFAIGTADEAVANEPNSLSPHDAVLVRWHSVLDEAGPT